MPTNSSRSRDRSWGCTANERVIHVEGPAFAALNAGRTRQPHPHRGADRRLQRRGRDAAALQPLGVVSILEQLKLPHTLNVMKVCAAPRSPRRDTVVLDRHRCAPLAGLALAPIIDEHTGVRPGVVNVVDADRHRIQQAADRRPADRHGQLRRDSWSAVR